VSELIYRIAQFLYEQPPGLVRLAQVYLALPGRNEGEIGAVLHRMRDQRLIEATFQNDALQLSAAGREAWNDGSIVELTLGIEYVAERYGPATVHIIVTGANGENAGSGFFSADYPGWIVTAAHVLLEREVLRIENQLHEVVAGPPFETLLPANGLDLALIRCDCPDGVNAIRIEWRMDAIRQMDSLLVLGFPAYAGLRPGLAHITAELYYVGQNFRSERRSLVLSSATPPGSSGGPVLNRRGRAIGVVEQERIDERLGEHPSSVFTATPALYLDEVRQPAADGGQLGLPVA
jgi:S1-C subfamily serine protease